MFLSSNATAVAAQLTAVVQDAKGKPLSDAVITLMPENGKLAIEPPKSMVIDQVNKEFVGHVTVVPINTPVYFPNKDDIRHHVYSFSKAKEFELPLYEGTPAEPVVFDKPGVVKLGCNIHDWMLGYVYVVETPYYGVTDDGGFALIKSVPTGRYIAKVWHPESKGESEATARTVELRDDAQNRLEFDIETRRVFRIRRAPVADPTDY